MRSTSPPRLPWIGVALLLGLTYVLVGRVFALPTDHARAWRLAAWAVSGVAFVAHLAFEHFRLNSAPRTAAFHVSVAVALGALALAFAGMIHSASTPVGIRPIWFLALILWPAITAIPAFLVALAAATAFGRLPRRTVAP